MYRTWNSAGANQEMKLHDSGLNWSTFCESFVEGQKLQESTNGSVSWSQLSLPVATIGQ